MKLAPFKVYKEAIDTGEYGHLFHPTKQALYNNVQDVEKLFPNLGPEAHRYIEIVTSDSYKKTMERIQTYTGRSPARHTTGTLMQAVMQALGQVQQIQRGREKELEKMALDIVLSLPEFKIFKKWTAEGYIKFDVRLRAADLSRAITDQEKQEKEEPNNENELTAYEEADEQVAIELTKVELSDDALKRRFANMLTQGNATNKLYLFQLANDGLNKIDPRLINLYGIMSVVIQALYYATPVMRIPQRGGDMAMGSAEVEPLGNGYVIKARSPFFPYLIHEIVKGCWDLLAVDVTSNDDLNGETLDDEMMQIMSGPQLYNNLIKFFPVKENEYLPYVYRLLLKEKPDVIKEVLAGGARAQSIITRLLAQAKEMIAKHEEDLNPPEEPLSWQ